MSRFTYRIHARLGCARAGNQRNRLGIGIRLELRVVYPTWGNELDWSLKPPISPLSTSSLTLPFTLLPSGLHFVKQDVVYFMKDSRRRACICRRRQTSVKEDILPFHGALHMEGRKTVYHTV
ncbi:hypothetical protein EDB85DRAFT_1975278 [Lactarius pseudohatsudake]|nr:hypothetical protein EDB85DRAFT_1975278 [Lactarius pseudohatsudake]